MGVPIDVSKKLNLTILTNKIFYEILPNGHTSHLKLKLRL